jgi:hypothetical protein
VPAAAVIPAPLAYIKIVAVKTFEVDYCPVRVLHRQVMVAVISDYLDYMTEHY